MVCEKSKPCGKTQEHRSPWRSLGREHNESAREEVTSLAEGYILGRLTDEQLERYEEHLFICQLCRQEVDLLTDLIETLRLAEDGIDPLPLHIVYQGPKP